MHGHTLPCLGGSPRLLPMPPTASEDDARGENRFLLQFFSDVADRRVRPLEEYQALFPEQEEEIAEQWRTATEALLGPAGERRPPTGAAHAVAPASWSGLLERLQQRLLDEARFEPRGELGRGGMGVIESLFDADLRRTVARKLCLASGAAEQGGTAPPKHLGRFLEEAQVTAQLEHPGVVPVHDLGMDGDGRPFFTMRLVRGKDLRAVFDQVRKGEEGWTRTRALGALLKACETMAYAHDKGVMHRDLKPANIMVGRFGEVYVMDWGLARVQGSEETRDLRLAPEPAVTQSLESLRRDERQDTPGSPVVTMEGDVMGTPSYMSPEQALGRVDELGPRSDVYAMGAILYDLLSGQAPYAPPAAPRTPFMILSLLQEGPPSALADITEDCPLELAAICEKAMQREPERRYSDMAEFAEDLRAYLEGRVVRAYETGALAEMKSWVRRNRAFAGTIAAGLLLVLVGSGTYAWQVGQERQAAVAAQQAAEAAQGRAEGVKDFLVTMLSSLDPQETVGMDKELMQLVLSQAAADVGQQFPDHPILEAEIQAVIGETYQQLGLYGAALPHFERALELRRVALGNQHWDTLLSIGDQARILRLLGRLQEAGEHFLEASRGWKGLVGEDHANSITSLSELAWNMRARGDLQGAEPLAREALARFQRTLGDTARSTLVTKRRLGNLLAEMEQFAEAETLLLETLERRRLALGETHPDTITSLDDLGVLLLDQGKFEEGVVYLELVAERAREVFGAEHPETLRCLRNLGGVYANLGRMAEAEELLLETLEASRRALGEHHVGTLGAYTLYADLLAGRGAHTLAEPHFRKAVEGQVQTLGAAHPWTLSTLSKYAASLRSQGRLGDAVAQYRTALSGTRELHGAEHPGTLRVLFRLASTLQELESYSEAEARYRELLELERRTLGEDHPDLLLTLSRLGAVLAEQGRASEAETIYREELEAGLRVQPEDRPRNLMRMGSLARVLISLDRLEESKALLEEALAGLQGEFGGDSPRTFWTLKTLAELHERWHVLEPEAGHDQRARELRSRLEALEAAAGEEAAETSGG